MFDQLPFGGGASIGLVPTLLNAAANNANWANLRDVNKFLCALIATNRGTDGDDIVVTLEQATDNAGTGAKALSIERVAYKVGDPGISSDVFTVDETITNEAPVASLDTDGYDAAQNDFLLLLRIRPQDLDMDNGFSHVRVSIAQTTAAQIGTVLYVPEGYAHSGAEVVGVVN